MITIVLFIANLIRIIINILKSIGLLKSYSTIKLDKLINDAKLERFLTMNLIRSRHILFKMKRPYAIKVIRIIIIILIVVIYIKLLLIYINFY
jgi:hypothetical protein